MMATDPTRPYFVLASGSPRRQELLRSAGFRFEVRPSQVAELRRPGEGGEDYALRLAREKALEVAARSATGELVMAADTVVMIDHQVLEKPRDAEDAARMLRALAGRRHSVFTAVCLVRAPSRIESLKFDTTLVAFRDLSDEEISQYIATGEPFDKAGGYAIQGLAGRFVERLEGAYSNVMGLPMPLVCEMLGSLLTG